MSVPVIDRVEQAREVSFPVTGMTCASCVRGIEKALNRVEGVHEASVNLATEKARVLYDAAVADFTAVSGAVEKAGYGVGQEPRTGAQHAAEARTEPEREQVQEPERERQTEIDQLRRRWMLALPVGLGMMALMYIPLPPDAMDVLMPALLVVATLVQFWAGSSFYRAAWAAAKHGSTNTNTNTLVALGTLVAWGYSTFTTLWPGIAERWGMPVHIYFETAIVIIALILGVRLQRRAHSGCHGRAVSTGGAFRKGDRRRPCRVGGRGTRGRTV